MRIENSRRTTQFIFLVCIASLCPVISPADEETSDAKYWIERLGAPRYSLRSDAMLKLYGLGRNAINALESTTRRGDADQSERAFGLLETHYRGDDATLRHEANSALKRIADDPSHPKSRAAKKVLEPDRKGTPNRLGVPMVFPGFNPAMRIQLNGGIQIKGGGGKKELSIIENGKKFRFVEDKDGIQVERPDGKGGMKKGSYRDAKELKEKDPDAHQRYEKFFGGKNGIRIQIGGAAKPAKPK